MASLKKVLESNRVPHAFLFTGPSGTGKTSLARIVAKEVGADPKNVLELDAATYTGIDSMRAVLSTLTYRAMDGNGKKFIIVDECHALSKPTWQSLLLSIEQPPEHVYWALCTTEADKVPQTIVTRCHAYDLRPVNRNILDEFLEYVVEEYKIEIGSEALGYIVDKAQGSVRQSLVDLSAAEGCQTRQEALQLLSSSAEAPELLDFLRKILEKKLTWRSACEFLKDQEQSPEGIRLVIVNYLATTAMGATDEKRILRLLNLLQLFKDPYRPNEKMAPLLLAIGQILFEE